MSPTRLVLEITTVAGLESSLIVANHFLHCGATTKESLTERYALMEKWPNTLRTDLVLRLADGRIESVGETRSFVLFFNHGLPLPVPQYPIIDGRPRDRPGRLRVAGLGVFLEFDGKVKYEKLLRPGQRASDVVIAEKERERDICRLTGWRCIRITWADLARPAATAAMIRGELFAPPSGRLTAYSSGSPCTSQALHRPGTAGSPVHRGSLRRQ